VKQRTLTLLGFFCLIMVAGTPPTSGQGEPLQTAKDRQIDIKHLKLELKVDLEKQSVDGIATLDYVAIQNTQNAVLDAVDFEVKGVSANGAETKFRHDGSRLFITFPKELKEDEKGQLKITYQVRDPKDGLFFFKPTKAEPNIPKTVWSQGEAITNRYWIPCADHPGQRQSSEMIVTVEGGYEVISNGKLVSKKVNADGTATFHWSQEKDHVSYLITLVVGKFDVVEEDWKGKPVTYYVPPGYKKDISRTFGRTREMLDFFSMRFGIDYPWEKYAQVIAEQFTGGGMENTSATTLTDRALHDERAFLDSDADGLIAHELGHQWWGDLVTCKDWAHLWLNEGFASYCEVLWDEHKKGKDTAQLDLYGKAKSAIAGGKDRPVVDRRYNSPRMMFDARAYPKGAWILHMLRATLGEEVFWKGIKAYGQEHKYKSIETSDLRKTLERVSGKSLEQFFYDWSERPGNPTLDINTEYQADLKLVRLAIKQTQAGDAFHFTLPIRVVIGGKAIDTKVNMKDKEMTTFIPIAEAPERIEIDPEITVLAEFNENKGRDWWSKQLLSGSTVVSRIRAAIYFGKSKEAVDRELLAKALKEEKFWGVAAEIAAALGESGGDISRDALLNHINVTDHKVRKAVVEHLAKFKGDAKVTESLAKILKDGDKSYFVEAAAISSFGQLAKTGVVEKLLPLLTRDSHAEVIRIAVLNGLAASKDPQALDAILTWTKKGKTRPARVAALGATVKLLQGITATPEEKKKALDAISLCLTTEGEMPAIRRAAVNALRDMGRDAAPSLDVLEAIRRHDPDEFVQDFVKKAITAVRNNAPVNTEMQRLREELDKLKRENNKFLERLDKIEKGKGW